MAAQSVAPAAGIAELWVHPARMERRRAARGGQLAAQVGLCSALVHVAPGIGGSQSALHTSWCSGKGQGENHSCPRYLGRG